MASFFLAVLVSSLCIGCGSATGGSGSGGSGGPGPSGSGGATASGGSSASGGASASGGSTASGGSSASGGSNASGGSSASGGASATGGRAGTGGRQGTGGATGSGGATATGGATGTGGRAGTGGGAGGSSGRFSFFMTSQAGLARLANNANGFGGDLRFGKTDGLAGADEICRSLAEASMPGNGKTWRALLSVTKGPGGTAVNAIDRVGEGPWYDRLGRTVAMNKTALLKERPEGADAAQTS